MGTNFYVRKVGKQVPDDRFDPAWHIGKRSAAGLYCWDCEITLCKGGNAKIHHGGLHDDISKTWHNTCPKCGKARTNEDLSQSAGGRELGFNKEKPRKKTGVASCSSFTWAQEPKSLLQRLKLSRMRKPIVDEYGRAMTLEEFEDALKECPVQYTHMIGAQFA